MIADGQLAQPLDIVTVVVPVAVYFFILGLLNSRRRPQLLSGRCDFAILAIALSPLGVLPMVKTLGGAAWTIPLAVAMPAVLIALLSPGRATWVIYNVSRPAARKAVARTVKRLGLPYRQAAEGLYLPGADATVRLGGLTVLRNVSVRLSGGDRQLARRFSEALGTELAGVRVEPTPTGVTLLLVATGMLAAPLTLVARDAPQVVRLLTDLF
ncbi:MAG: hypothetical protein KGY99_08150 [Phycisphaerae bacterium]|nr:hypothetical protein [Phycisphaerae bacterium]